MPHEVVVHGWSIVARVFGRAKQRGLGEAELNLKGQMRLHTAVWGSKIVDI